MKIVVIGTRGFPGIRGGVETHCQELYTRLVSKGYDVTVFRRKPYINYGNKSNTYKGVNFVDIAAPHNKYFEAIVHTLYALFRSRKLKPDILHIHNIGPAIVAPLARLMGMKVVLTIHSFNYTHSKWGRFAKFMLKLGERLGVTFSNCSIAISDVNYKSLNQRYPNIKCNLIYNGVSILGYTDSRDRLAKWGVGGRPYIVAVGRLTPEKGFHDLVKAYVDSKLIATCDLVIAGSADNEDDYSRSLVKTAAENGVKLTGFINGEDLRQLMSHASLFAITSYNEGLPLSLLEAMAYGLDVVASNIEPCKISCLNEDDFYPVGDTDALAKKLSEKISAANRRREYDLTPYDWDNIACRTVEVYKSL